MSDQNTINTLADVRRALPSIYSAKSAEVYASVLDRVLKLTRHSSLTQIPADVVAWEDEASRIVWAGAFPAANPAKAEKNFNEWVRRVSAAIRAARKAASPAAPKADGVEADWDALIAYARKCQNVTGPDGRKILPGMSAVSVGNLRSRLGEVAPRSIDTARSKAALLATPAGKRDSLRRSLRFLNRLIANRSTHRSIDALLPPEPIGGLPVLRSPRLDWSRFSAEFLGSRDALIHAAMRTAPRLRSKDVFGGRLGKPGLRGAPAGARGRRRKVTNKAAASKAHNAALSWLVRHAFEDQAEAALLSDVSDLLTEENVARAVDAYVGRARGSDVLKQANETSSVTTWLTNLTTLARKGLGDEDLAFDIEELKFSEDVETSADREMSSSRAAFVRMIDYDPGVARAIVLAPQTLHREALRGLKDWETLGTNARIRVLHTLAAAAMWAIQLGRPLRTRNLNELTTGGDDPQINAPRSGEADPYMFIAKEKVKNRRNIEGRIHPAYWKILDDWIELGRPKLIKIHAGRGFHDSEYLFPGTNGALCRQSLNNIWNLSTGMLGLGKLTPHMMRHVAATLHLAVHPGDYAVVAALLCDSVRTVEKFYARGEGRAAADLFLQTLSRIHPEVAAIYGKAA